MDLSALHFSDFKMQKFYVFHNVPNTIATEFSTVPGKYVWERLWYIDKGTIDFIQNNQVVFCAKAGDLVFIPYDCAYRFANHVPGALANAYIIGFLFYNAQNEPILLGDQLERFEGEQNVLLQEMAREIIKTYLSLEIGYKLKCQSKFLELLHFLLVSSADAGKNPRMDAVLQHVHNHYTEEISVNDLIEMSCLSPSTFRRQFQRCTGMAPVAYIHFLKMQKAYELLLSTDLSMTQIAEKISVTDSAYFSKLFKRFYGASPLKIRSRGA